MSTPFHKELTMAKQKRRSKGNGLTVQEAVAKYAHMGNKELAELTGASMASIYRVRWLIKQNENQKAVKEKADPQVAQLDLFKEWQEDEAPKALPPQPNNVRLGIDESVIADLRIAAERLSSALQKLV